MISFNLHYLLKVLSPNTITLWLGASIHEFWGQHGLVHSILSWGISLANSRQDKEKVIG